MKKYIITIISAALLSMNVVEAKDINSENQLSISIEQYENEFEQKNFTHIEQYSGIIAFCNSIPRQGEEFNLWLSVHIADEGLNIKHMDQQVKECSNVSKKSYNELENLYRKALAHGEKTAPLVLGKLFPFVSPEKVALLRESSYWSEEAVDLIAEIVLNNDVEMSSIEQYFWLNVSNSKMFYPEEYNVSILELHPVIDGSVLIQIDTLVAEWSTASSNKKSSILLTLQSLK